MLNNELLFIHQKLTKDLQYLLKVGNSINNQPNAEKNHEKVFKHSYVWYKFILDWYIRMITLINNLSWRTKLLHPIEYKKLKIKAQYISDISLSINIISTTQLVQLIEDRNVKSEYLFVFKNGSKGHVLKNLIAIYHKPTQQKLYKQQWTNSIKNFWTNYKLNVKYSIYTGIIDNNNEYTRIRLRNATKNELT